MLKSITVKRTGNFNRVDMLFFVLILNLILSVPCVVEVYFRFGLPDPVMYSIALMIRLSVAVKVTENTVQRCLKFLRLKFVLKWLTKVIELYTSLQPSSA